jgi:parallel beta-helix repeat protein
MIRSLLVLLLATIVISLAQPGVTGTLYTVPNGTFYQQPTGETVTTINDTSGSISTLQAAINSARTANATRFLIINLKSNTEYLVTTNPLILGSKMCLSGSSNTSIAASSSTTATSLIKITSGSSYTSVNFLALNGNQADLYGIEAPGVNRVSVDQLVVRQTGRAGLFLQGLGSASFGNQITVTRCEVSEATTAAGIHLSATTQAACLDNLCHNNACGILLESSAHATLVNNQAKFNTLSGIGVTNITWSKITHNLCQGNGTGFSIAGSTTLNQWNFFVSNEIRTSPEGISLGGYANVLYDNLFASDVAAPLVFRTGNEAGVNRIFATSTPLSATGQEYFYPPTKLNFHTNPIMNGKDRTDITTSATTLSAIQTTYNAARASNPNNVTVLRLTAPSITGDAPLSLFSNTCVLLDGTIKLNPGISAFSASNSTFLSISGGTVDGQNTTGRNGLTFSNCSRFVIDQVNLKNFGVKTNRVTGSDVLALLNCGTPSIVGRCTLDGGAARGIWSKSGGGHILSDNSSANMNMDGIDMDAYVSSSLVQFNSTVGNIRSGLFVEEAAKHNQLIGNLTSLNPIGINVYSYAAGPTSYNSFIANTCQANTRGLRTGGAISKTTDSITKVVTTIINRTENNFFFNNIVSQTPKSSNSSDAAICAQNYGSENYFARHSLNSNVKDYSETASAIFFNSPFITTTFTSSLGYFDWQQSFTWSASTSLLDADPNQNGLPNLLEYALDLNPLSQTPPTLPSVGWNTSTPDGPWLTFTYRHNLKADDLTYDILSSEDLKTWSVLNVDEVSTFSETVDANPDGDGSCELLRIRTLTDPSLNKLFLRLRVTRQ